jgi:hypothetical protein
MVFCPVIVVMMLESRVVRCVHCDEDAAKATSSSQTAFGVLARTKEERKGSGKGKLKE